MRSNSNLAFFYYERKLIAARRVQLVCDDFTLESRSGKYEFVERNLRVI